MSQFIRVPAEEKRADNVWSQPFPGTWRLSEAEVMEGFRASTVVKFRIGGRPECQRFVICSVFLSKTANQPRGVPYYRDRRHEPSAGTEDHSGKDLDS